jgi:hypothetical protein
VASLGESVQEQYVEPALEASSSVLESANDAVASQFVQSTFQVASDALKSVNEAVSSQFVVSAAEPSSSVVENAAADLFSAGTATPVESSVTEEKTTTEESPSWTDTVVSTVALLGAGIVTQPLSWWDTGTDIGTVMADVVTENLVYTENYLAGKGWGNKTGLVITEKTKSSLGENSREAILGAIEETTGIETSESPVTEFFLPGIQKGIQSEDTGTRALSVVELLGAGLADWAAGNPGTAVASWEVQTLDLAGQVANPEGDGGDIISGLKTAFDLVVKSPTQRAMEAAAKEQILYKVTVVSSKPVCWGKLVGTSGCP